MCESALPPKFSENIMHKNIVINRAEQLQTFTNRQFFGLDEIWTVRLFVGYEQIIEWLKDIAEYEGNNGNTRWIVRDH